MRSHVTPQRMFRHAHHIGSLFNATRRITCDIDLGTSSILAAGSIAASPIVVLLVAGIGMSSFDQNSPGSSLSLFLLTWRG